MGISDLDLNGAIQRMNVVLPNLKNDQAQFDLKTILDALAAQAQEIKTLESRLIPPLYHEGHECCRKCVMENAALGKEK